MNSQRRQVAADTWAKPVDQIAYIIRTVVDNRQCLLFLLTFKADKKLVIQELLLVKRAISSAVYGFATRNYL